MIKRRNVFAAVLCALLLISLFVSSAYALHEATHHHGCTGEDCPICQFIARIEQLRRGFGMAFLAWLLVWLVVAIRQEGRTGESAEVPSLCTLVGRKIRLND